MFSAKLYLKNVIKGGVKTAGNHKCLWLWLFHTVSPDFLVFYTVSLCFTLFNLFGIEFVANRALWVALNLSQITHFLCKFLGPKKSACVNVLTYSTSGQRIVSP